MAIKVYAVIVKKGLPVPIRNPREEFGIATNSDREWKAISHSICFLRIDHHES
jgi:hypothetical protein